MSGSVAEQPVAARLVRLCRRRDGTVPIGPMLAATSRAALLADLALHGALTTSAIWTRQHGHLGHRYEDADPAAVKADRARVRAALDDHPHSPATAVLAILLAVVGTAAWLMRDLAGYLLARGALLKASAHEARIGMSVNFIQ